MKYIILDKFTNNIVVNGEGEVLEFDSYINASIEASECQDGLVIPLHTTRLFTEQQVLDLILSMDIAINPETYESSKNLGTEDFCDLANCKADEYGLTEKFNKLREPLINKENII